MHEFGLWVPADCVAAISPRRKRDALAVVAQSLLVPVVRSRDVRGVFPAQP